METSELGRIRRAVEPSGDDMSHNLNSFKGGYIGDYIRDYYMGY